MAEENPTTDQIFPKDSSKTYALVELMRGKGPMVGKGPEDTVFAFPIVLLLETILFLGVTLGIFIFSLLKQAPLDEIANPLITTDPAKAPWYFVGLQELLEHMHPAVAGVLLPTILIGFLIAIPYIDYSKVGSGVWFTSLKGKRIVKYTAVYTLVVMSAYVVLDNIFSVRELLRESTAQWVAQGLVPGGILVLLAILPPLLLILKKANRREVLLALFTVMIVSAVVFTISGFLFRGPGFKLYWPWEMPNGYNPWDEL